MKAGAKKYRIKRLQGLGLQDGRKALPILKTEKNGAKNKSKAKKKQTNAQEISEKRLTLWGISGNVRNKPNQNAKVDGAVDWKDINTKHRKDALIKLTGSRNVGLTIAKIERDILTHRKEQNTKICICWRQGMVGLTASTILLGTYETEKMTQL